ncbi:MAG TPA: tetratricopeptide repeat protein [Patescibacteria group bacterium]|jgi:tetratricopeptide (TPR) repeat protein|nr:tetratricopeptide repeat protein [Patescibacteria group bacterium]
MKAKKHLFLLILLLLFSPLICKISHKDLLVAVLMVKDEEAVMASTLEPLVQAGIESFFILDTGSTDKTIEKTKYFFSEFPHCTCVIESEPFVDFATSRNKALDLAEKSFPEAHFMLMLDAEWHLVNGNLLLDFCVKAIDEIEPVYLIRIISGIDFYTSRLIRCKTGARFEGVVHECIAAQAKVLPEVYFELHTTQYGAEKSRRRWQRDKQLLLRAFKDNPYDSRSLFYLAQTCQCLGQTEEALQWYEARLSLPGWDEENFITLYRIAQLYEELARASTDKAILAKAIYYYMEAYHYRPTRAEPLVRLALLYRAQDYFYPAFLFAQKAVSLPYPHNDSLFIEKELYDYDRYDVLGIVAWYCQEHELGEWAVLKALKAHPDYSHLHHNLLLYIEEKKSDKKIKC